MNHENFSSNIKSTTSNSELKFRKNIREKEKKSIFGILEITKTHFFTLQKWRRKKDQFLHSNYNTFFHVSGHSESTASVVSSASSCPQDCHCPQDSSSSSGLEETLVNCNGLNLTQPPIPIEDSMASNLRLDGNRIAQIDLVFLKHFPNLKVLNLNQNGLRWVKLIQRGRNQGFSFSTR